MLLSMMVSGLVAIAAPMHLQAGGTPVDPAGDSASASHELTDQEKAKLQELRWEILDKYGKNFEEMEAAYPRYKGFIEKAKQYSDTEVLTDDEKAQLKKIRKKMIVNTNYQMSNIMDTYDNHFDPATKTMLQSYLKDLPLQPEQCTGTGTDNTCDKDQSTEKGALSNLRYKYISGHLTSSVLGQILMGDKPGFCKTGLCDKIKTYVVSKALSQAEKTEIEQKVAGITGEPAFKLALCAFVDLFKEKNSNGYNSIKDIIKVNATTIDQYCSPS